MLYLIERINMKKIIHIFGASGSGTTTLGKFISTNFNFHQMDTDNYFWEKTNPPFLKKRNSEECINLILEEFNDFEQIVLSGSICGWGDQLIQYFSLAVELIVPSDIRYKRIMIRELNTFGDRVMSDGDMYMQNLNFLEWAMGFDSYGPEHRSRIMHDAWIKKLNCPFLQIDGTKSLEEIGNQLIKYL